MLVEWECTECGYLFEGKQPPHKCPDCRTVDAWEKVEYVDDWDDDAVDDDDEWEDMD